MSEIVGNFVRICLVELWAERLLTVSKPEGRKPYAQVDLCNAAYHVMLASFIMEHTSS